MRGEATMLLEQAKALYSEGKLEESEVAFKRVIASGNGVADGFYGVGLVRGSMRDWNAAAANFEQALRHDPRHANALYQLGFVAEEKDNLQEARAYYRMALVANPQHLGAQKKLKQFLKAKPSADGAIVGVVRGFRQRSEADYPFALFPWQIWAFRLDRLDEEGNTLPSVPVEMRGHSFEGFIDEGDEVELPGSWRAGEVVHAKEVYNRTKGVAVRANERPGSRLDRNLQSHTLSVVGRFIAFLFVIAVLLFVAWGVLASNDFLTIETLASHKLRNTEAKA